MPGFGDLVQKAFYLGVGAASYAAEKAGQTLHELKGQAQKLADEMVEKGEMTTEEARKFVDDFVKQAQQKPVESSQESQNKEPRRIEIVSDEADQPSDRNQADNLRQQVESLQEELRRLKRE
jgi:polyhydroxyalkanoate synthesis regulator phasin